MNKDILTDNNILGGYVASNEVAFQSRDTVLEIAHGQNDKQSTWLSEFVKQAETIELVADKDSLDLDFGESAEWSDMVSDYLVMVDDFCLITLSKEDYLNHIVERQAATLAQSGLALA